MLHPEDHEAVAQAEKDKQEQVSKKGKVESDQIHFLAIKMTMIQIAKLTQVHLTSILMNQDIAYVTKWVVLCHHIKFTKQGKIFFPCLLQTFNSAYFKREVLI